MAFSTISLDEKNKKQSNEIKNLTKEIQTLEKEKIELKKLALENNKPNSSTVSCKFTKTFKVLYIFDNWEADLDYTFIVVDQFQGFSPFTLRIKKEYIKNLKLNNYYEFSVNGDDDFNSYKILGIKETNKVGFEQIQESCK